jgi:hypothetical protein
MSNPENNRWFRRRWQDDAPNAAPAAWPASAPTDPVERTAQALLLAWHREQAQRGAVA